MVQRYGRLGVKNIEVVQLISKFANSFSNLAYKLVSNPKVSSHLYISKPMGNVWILGKEVVVTFFGSFTQHINHTAL